MAVRQHVSDADHISKAAPCFGQCGLNHLQGMAALCGGIIALPHSARHMHKAASDNSAAIADLGFKFAALVNAFDGHSRRVVRNEKGEPLGPPSIL